MEEKGLECVFHVAGAGRGGDQRVGRVSGLEGAGKELGGKEGEVVVEGFWFLCEDARNCHSH